MPCEFPLAIHWFRRDLRIADNSALHHASRSAGSVLPVYIRSTWSGAHLWTGPNRQAFLCQSLSSLAANLETIGGQLTIRSGGAVEELLKLVEESGAQAIFFNSDPDPFGKLVETELAAACLDLGIQCRGFHDHTVHEPNEVLTQSSEPYRVFTPYFRNWRDLPKPSPLPKPRDLATPSGIPSLPLPTLADWDLPEAGEILPAGEREARKRMKRAVDQVGRYATHRDSPSAEATTRLSQDLRHGLISPRTLIRSLEKKAEADPSARKGSEKLISELAWREFYFAILHHYPEVLDSEFNPNWRGLPWEEPAESFEAWKTGRTGFPLVDAGMRELLATGHMHNRLRMITAMFLTKDLHVDWRLGESFFLQQLVDGEIASNNGGWQWSAGTGADAAPYFRIQNPWLQSKRHDPQGRYIKRWVPELADVPAPRLHQPPADGSPLAAGYPLPCVDHHAERDRTLAIFKRHKEEIQ